MPPRGQLVLPPPDLFIEPPVLNPGAGITGAAGAIAGPVLEGVGKIVLRIAVGALGATLIIVGLVMIAADTRVGSAAVNAVPGGSAIRKAVGK
jgi:hypothetical protein